ncbi:MAG: DUF1566 domain-containing protein, partial [Nitrospira sp.]|nr:DUF1566 domain-containing protein [Nitrospira sp.]
GLVTQDRAVQVITAGKKGEQVIEKDGHGVFTNQLLKAFQGFADVDQNGLIIGIELASFLISRVYRETDGRQNPQFAQLYGEGQFVFVLTEPPPPCPEEPCPPELPKLRDTHTILSYEDIVQKIQEKGFSLPKENIVGTFQHDYEPETPNGKKVVIDHATGLMWQQSGSFDTMTWEGAKAYVDQLNKDRYTGFSGWRLPTIEELASLLESTRKNEGLYIDPVFDIKQMRCWSADQSIKSHDLWVVDFYEGVVDDYTPYSYYVRAVRSVRQ